MRILQTLALLAGLLASSCSWSRSEINDTNIPGRASKIDFEQTNVTEDELIEAIGTPPGQIIFLPDGRRLLLYNYGQSRTQGLTLILFNFLKTNVAIDTAIFLVDPNGRVVDKWVGTNSEDVPFEWYPFGD